MYQLIPNCAVKIIKTTSLAKVHFLYVLNTPPTLIGKWVLKGGAVLNFFVRSTISQTICRHRIELNRQFGP